MEKHAIGPLEVNGFVNRRSRFRLPPPAQEGSRSRSARRSRELARLRALSPAQLRDQAAADLAEASRLEAQS